MKNSNVLVTGATHFIGSHLIERLVSLGSQVKVFIRYDYHNDQGILKYLPVHIQNKIEIVSGDLTNPEAIEYATSGVEVIYHLGTVDIIPYLHINLRDLLEANVIGTFNVLNAAKKYKVQKLVYISTGDVYGNVEHAPIDEIQPLSALSPQIATYIGAEKLVEGYHLSEGIPVVITRLFNLYGPTQSKKAIIPTIIAQALVEPKLYLGNMHAIRDFVYVEDVVDGLIKAAETPESIGETINLGSGQGISVGDLAEKILMLIDRDIEILFDATRIRPQSHDIEYLVANITKANELLDWQPSTSLDGGLQHTIDWFSEHLDMGQIVRRS